MCCMGLIKKVVPFFLTLAVGLFVASFFVSIPAPNFSISSRGWRRHQQFHQQMESDNQRLRDLNLRLEKALAERERAIAEREEIILSGDNNFDVPPPPAPIAPYKAMSQRR